METRYLKTIQMVLETGSFSRAAEELCISQSAVSQRIKFLEDHYGCLLIDRSCSILKPTPAGQKVLDKTELILLAMHDIEVGVKNVKNPDQLSVGFTPTFGTVYLPQVLQKFMQQNTAEINLKFIVQQPDQSIRELRNNNFDIVIAEHCNELPTFEDIIFFPLLQDTLTLVSSPSLGIPNVITSLNQIYKYTILTRKEGCSSRCLFAKNLNRFDSDISKFSGVDIYDDLHLILHFLLNGHGISFVSRSLVESHILNEELREHQIAGFDFIRSRTMACHKLRINDCHIKSFIECAHSVFDFPSPLNTFVNI